MKNRIELITHFKDLGYTKGAEIGVFDGRFSEVICQTIPGVELLCVDSWVVGEIFPKKKIAVERLAKYPNVTIMHNTSLDAAKVINDGSLDFAFIDGEHSFKSVNEDVHAWAPKVKIGGVVAFHDYYVTKTGNKGVMEAVDQYVIANNYELRVTPRDKDNPVRDDRQPTAWFVKTH
jgi:hypothetical protein